MASSATTGNVLRLPAERFFRASLSLLILTALLTLGSTGKLDIATAILGPLAALYKGYRWFYGRPAELSHRGATWLLVAYLVFFSGGRRVSVSLPRRQLFESSAVCGALGGGALLGFRDADAFLQRLV